MKRLVLLSLLFCSFVGYFFSPTISFAQSAVSCWLTQIGTPQGDKPQLPPECTAQSSSQPGAGGASGGSKADATCPGIGPVTCESKYGSSPCHCTADYQTNVCGGPTACGWCNPPGQSSSEYAIDISNPLEAGIYIPKIHIPGTDESHTLTCLGYDADVPGALEPSQIIQTVSCQDDVTNKAVWLHFHHSSNSTPTVPDKTYKTGDLVGRSGAFVNSGTRTHVHFQLGTDSPCEEHIPGSVSGCKPADDYVQCN